MTTSFFIDNSLILTTPSNLKKFLNKSGRIKSKKITKSSSTQFQKKLKKIFIQLSFLGLYSPFIYIK